MSSEGRADAEGRAAPEYAFRIRRPPAPFDFTGAQPRACLEQMSRLPICPPSPSSLNRGRNVAGGKPGPAQEGAAALSEAQGLGSGTGKRERCVEMGGGGATERDRERLFGVCEGVSVRVSECVSE